MGKLRQTLSFISNLKAEFFMFLWRFNFTYKMLPLSQMLQDKICVNKDYLNITGNPSFCYDLSTIKSDDSPSGKLKNEIIAQETIFGMYMIMLLTLPSIIWSPLVGPWCDKYIHARKIIMLLGAAGGVLENVIATWMAVDFKLDYRWSILHIIPQVLNCGMVSSYIAVYSYISVTSTSEGRSQRFMAVEVLNFLCQPLASVSAPLLMQVPVPSFINNGQLHNYPLAYVVNTLVSVAAFFWVYLFIDETRDRTKLQETINVKLRSEGKEPVEVKIESCQHPWSELFKWNNFKLMAAVGMKKRPDGGRKVIWLAIGALFVFLLGYVGPLSIMFQFTQRVYHWDYKTWGYVKAGYYTLNSFGTMIGVLALTKWLKLSDVLVTVVGLISYFFKMIIRGSIQNVFGFVLSAIVGSISSIALVGGKSFLSKMVPEDELGKLFSLIAFVDAFVPLLSQLFATMTFAKTIDFFPGLVFEITALMMVVPIFCMLYIRTCEKKMQKQKEPRDEEANCRNKNEKNDEVTTKI